MEEHKDIINSYIPENDHAVHTTKDPESGLQIIDGDGNFAFVKNFMIFD